MADQLLLWIRTAQPCINLPPCALGTLGYSKRGEVTPPPWQTECSLGQDRASPVRFCHASYVGREVFFPKKVCSQNLVTGSIEMTSTFQSLPIFFQSLSARARISSSSSPSSHSIESVSENAPWSICKPSSVAVNTASKTKAGKFSSVCFQEKSSNPPSSIASAC